jgi:serine/threonine protein kinase
VRLLALPPKFQTIINPAAGLGPLAPAVVRSNNRLSEFLQLALQEKEVRAKHMLLQDPSELESKITGRPDISFLPLQNGAEQIIFSSRRVSQKTISDKAAFKSLEFDMCVLAAALNCVDPVANIRLLKVEYCFYHAESSQFLFAHIPPYRTMSMMTLEKLISGDPFPETEAPLDQRLKLAQKLAEAVLFLHAVDFLHKNITSSSVVALRRWDESAEPSSSLDDAYLMGFDLIRGAEAKTTKEGAVKQADETPRSIWEFDIYQHPDRQQGEKSLKYTKTYDVYSLGVVLLEIGLWRPLSKEVKGLDKGNPSSWATKLHDLAVSELSPRIGEGYQRLVLWCLSLSGNDGMKKADFVEHVLDPLEDMANTMS